jgi:hypothetical protein
MERLHTISIDRYTHTDRQTWENRFAMGQSMTYGVDNHVGFAKLGFLNYLYIIIMI